MQEIESQNPTLTLTLYFIYTCIGLDNPNTIESQILHLYEKKTKKTASESY